ncbi:MAG: hypothetical protein KKA62_03880 [Nanoarchaeota archaeon]|nr:hypothetical protein [Nanoarchaeota archaeon]MBU1643794.1 hypothetical protein [Nanoarchaeota archaeon]MBU1977065.1 hypothetical protein [Nanoarchaeota archaeon]
MTIKKNKLLETGVPGLDKILKGGITENNAVIISGGPGTGKTVLALQFLIEGAKKGEPGLLLVYDGEEDMVKYADSFGIDLRKYIKSGLITIMQQPILLRKISNLGVPIRLIKDKKIKRVALDSLSMYSYCQVVDRNDYRRAMVTFLHNMKSVTLMATNESKGSNIDEMDFGPEDFLFGGVILLAKVRSEATFERVIHVSKMRGQNHLLDIYPYTIGKGGIKAYPDQLPFSLMDQENVTKKK